MNTNDLKEIIAIAAEESRMASVRCMEWVGALAEDWERRADEMESDAAMPGAEYRAAAMRQMAREMRLRAESESAPTSDSTTTRSITNRETTP